MLNRKSICVLVSLAISALMLVCAYADIWYMSPNCDEDPIEPGAGKDVYFEGSSLKELEDFLNALSPANTAIEPIEKYPYSIVPVPNFYSSFLEREANIILPSPKAKINSIEILSIGGMPTSYCCQFTLDGKEYSYSCALHEEYEYFPSDREDKKMSFNGRELYLTHFGDEDRIYNVSWMLDGKYYCIIRFLDEEPITKDEVAKLPGELFNEKPITKDEVARLPDELFNAQRKTLRELRTAPMGGDEIAIIEPLEACNAECE